MMIVAGCKFSQFVAVGGGVGIPAIVLLIVKSPYRLKRVVSFLDPWKDATDTGWQVIQSLYAIGSGGLFLYLYLIMISFFLLLVSIWDLLAVQLLLFCLLFLFGEAF